MYQQIYLHPGIIQILRLKSPFGGLGVGNLINARIPILPILYLQMNQYIISITSMQSNIFNNPFYHLRKLTFQCPGTI